MTDSSTEPLRITRLGRGWLVQFGTLTALSSSGAGKGVPAKLLAGVDLVLDSERTEGPVLVDPAGDGWHVRWEGTSLGIGRPPGLAGRSLDVALLPEGAAIGNLTARFAIPSSAPGVGGPRGIPLQTGECVTFAGRAEELYVYSIDPVPKGAADRWRWLRRA